MLAVGNADLNSTEDSFDLVHRAYQGLGLVILQATGVPGVIRLKATSAGLEPGVLTIPVGPTLKLLGGQACRVLWLARDTSLGRQVVLV